VTDGDFALYLTTLMNSAVLRNVVALTILSQTYCTLTYLLTYLLTLDNSISEIKLTSRHIHCYS